MATKFENIEKFIINTGNILSLNDITKKSGQSPSDELIEAISITLKEFQNSHQNDLNSHEENGNSIVINRDNDDLMIKMGEEDISKLKIGIKLFLNKDSKASTSEALDKVFTLLNVTCVDNVTIALKDRQSENAEDIESLKKIWSVLECYVGEQKINQIGVADVEESTFRNIFQWAKIKPNIIQINLASCCVVPPSLQAFCKDNDVQLLTHSDPIDILPKKSVDELFGKPLSLQWVVRFLVHIKCRGVLTTKGYLISLGASK